MAKDMTNLITIYYNNNNTKSMVKSKRVKMNNYKAKIHQMNNTIPITNQRTIE
jgi:hypothetical protein